MYCRRCGGPVVDGSQRCGTCGTRSYAKDPFVGITDYILVQEMIRRNLWSERQQDYVDLVDEKQELQNILKSIRDLLFGSVYCDE